MPDSQAGGGQTAADDLDHVERRLRDGRGRRKASPHPIHDRMDVSSAEP